MPANKLHFTFQNLGKHIFRSFDLWDVKTVTRDIKLERSLIYVGAILGTIYWPISDQVTNSVLLIITWILLSLTSRNLPRLFLLFFIMLNIRALFEIINYSFFFLSSSSSSFPIMK